MCGYLWKVFNAKGTASAKALKAESVWHTQEQEAGQTRLERMTDVGEMLWEVRSESSAESKLP